MSKIYKRLLKQSINSLRKSGVKSFLTLLGIFIGSATIILVYELGAAAQQSIEQQYSNMSVKTIIINGPSTGGEKSNLSINDLEPLTNINVIDKVAPQLTGRLIVSSSLESPSLNIFGTDINMVDVGNLELQQGRFFDDIENKNKSKVVVLGYESAQLLFGETFETITGETVTINRKSYEIIGVLKYKGGSFGSVTIDDSVFIPYSVAERYILGNSGKFSINVIVDDFNNLVLAQDEISTTLRDLHNIRGADTEDFKIKDMGSVVQSAQESAKTMSILLWSVGLIVLVVGGIGIMNIMYTSVLERTKEIGILKALGAKDNYIMFLFLSEAVILSLLGFFVGAILSFLIYYSLTFTTFSINFEPIAYLFSFISTVSIGTVFGFYPAKKASRLTPVDALRYE